MDINDTIALITSLIALVGLVVALVQSTLNQMAINELKRARRGEGR